jgi:hypothetical protein
MVEHIKQIKITIKVEITTNKQTYSENFNFDSLDQDCEFETVEKTFKNAKEHYEQLYNEL